MIAVLCIFFRILGAPVLLWGLISFVVCGKKFIWEECVRIGGDIVVHCDLEEEFDMGSQFCLLVYGY